MDLAKNKLNILYGVGVTVPQVGTIEQYLNKKQYLNKTRYSPMMHHFACILGVTLTLKTQLSQGAHLWTAVNWSYFMNEIQNKSFVVSNKK